MLSMEQSLSRISKAKKADGPTDDDKIRLQLRFDVMAFAEQANQLGMLQEENVSLLQLLETVNYVKGVDTEAPGGMADK